MKGVIKMLSSIGLHTLTISLLLQYSEAILLIQNFKEYSKRTGLIQMYRVNETGHYIKYDPNEELIPLHIMITYHVKYIGITWHISFYNTKSDFKQYIVYAKLNPKILSGITDYLTAATLGDLNVAIINFNHEAKQISPILKDFNYYNLTRLDYCINFSLNELFPTCDAEQIVSLIQRSNIPSPYKEWREYDNISHRSKSKPGSFYLTSKSIHINCYSKYIQLKNLSEENIANNRPPIPDETINKSKDIIRFEVQCKYAKAYSLSHKYSSSGINYSYKYMQLFTPTACKEIIIYYYEKIIGKGDWCSLSYAISIIKSQKYNSQKEQRLIETLKQINQCRSVAKAIKYYTDDTLAKFNKTLNDLNSININPVTIPKDWGIKHIPNILYTYFNKEILELSNSIFE